MDFLIDLKLVYEEKSSFQDIKLYETKENQIMLTLDTFIQFIEGKDEEVYHDTLIRPTYEMNPTTKKWLILGGGDGLCARNIFDIDKDASVTLVELDEQVIKLCFKHDRLTSLNKNSLDKCTIFCWDALKWIDTFNEKYDIIICDFPDPNNDELKKLYEESFLKKVKNHLNPKGIIAIQCHFDIANEMSLILQTIFGNRRRIEYKMPSLEGGEIILAWLN